MECYISQIVSRNVKSAYIRQMQLPKYESKEKFTYLIIHLDLRDDYDPKIVLNNKHVKSIRSLFVFYSRL